MNALAMYDVEPAGLYGDWGITVPAEESIWARGTSASLLGDGQAFGMSRGEVIGWGIAGSILAGGLVTLLTGLAFRSARTARAWTPGLIVGGGAAAVGLLRTALVASRY